MSIKIKFLVGDTADVVPAAFQQEFIDTIERIMHSTRPFVVVDRGHTHHDRRSEICLWMKPRAEARSRSRPADDAGDGRPPRPPDDDDDDDAGDDGHGPSPGAREEHVSSVPRSAHAGADPGSSAPPGVDRNVRPRLHGGAPPHSGWCVRNTFLEYRQVSGEEVLEPSPALLRCHSAPHIDLIGETQYFDIGDSDDTSSFDESDLVVGERMSLLPWPPIPPFPPLGVGASSIPPLGDPWVALPGTATPLSRGTPLLGVQPCFTLPSVGPTIRMPPAACHPLLARARVLMDREGGRRLATIADFEQILDAILSKHQWGT